MKERLDKVLANLERFGSRKEVSRLLKSGAVLVNGSPVKDGSLKVDPDSDSLQVGGETLRRGKTLTLMMHKPPGVLCAARDSRQPVVLDLLPPEFRPRGLFPAGRLDKDTTGLLILTNDGALAHRILSPKSGIVKRYEARVARPVTEEDAQRFAKGISQGGDDFAPAKLWGEERDGEHLAWVEITEGKYHQVKRMFAAVGNEVLTLKRLKIGGLALDESLAPGESRVLEEREIARIFIG